MSDRCDIAVIGGGLVGLMAAGILAEAGKSVALFEASDLGAEASGANAGSLHLQIQYPEFVKYGEGWAKAYAPTLRFLSDSIGLWRDLDASGAFSVKTAGGLVVANTEDQMAAIRAKARIEADVGVRTDILTKDELRDIAPYLSDAAIGAGFCADEGKADTLSATPLLACRARDAGARINRMTAITGIETSGSSFRLQTNTGATITAAKIVNAAGARAGRIAHLLGERLELDGFPLQVTVTEPIAPLIPHLVYSAAGKLTLKQAINGGCIIGGGWAARVLTGGGLATNPTNFALNMALAVDAVPALAPVRGLRSWTAWVNGTPDWRPIIGEAPGCPGLFHAVFPWVGFTAAPMTGQVVADLVLGRAPSSGLKGVSVLYD